MKKKMRKKKREEKRNGEQRRVFFLEERKILKKKIEMNGEKKRREKGGQKVKEKEERNSNAKIGENRGEYRGIKKRKFEAETKTMWRWGVQKRKFIKNERRESKKKRKKGGCRFSSHRCLEPLSVSHATTSHRQLNYQSPFIPGNTTLPSRLHGLLICMQNMHCSRFYIKKYH